MFKESWNPPNRFERLHYEPELPGLPQELQLLLDDTQRILTRNQSPDIGFEYSINCYRGCTHACAYCLGRDYHELLGLGAGTDFERRIVLKPRAADLLEQAFLRPGWRGREVAFSTVTDAYQPLEARHRLTRACLQVCVRFRNPVVVITRSPLVVRDLDLFRQLHARRALRIGLSLPWSDARLCRLLEPGAPSPAARLTAMETLGAAGLSVGVAISPIIPGLNDSQVPTILRRARRAGASWAWISLLRLPRSVALVFARRLQQVLPQRAASILTRLRQARGGQLDDGRFGTRLAGQDENWKALRRLFELQCKRLGYGEAPEEPRPSPFRVPGGGQQLALFQQGGPPRAAAPPFVLQSGPRRRGGGC